MTSVPGRGDLRISLTTFCNLRCEHCHNEGASPPWEKDVNDITTQQIEQLLSVGNNNGVRSVKFTGGDPTVYHSFFELLDKIKIWRSCYENIKKWGISTNGILFLNEKYYDSLVTSELDNICVGIDSISLGSNSKPSSKNGVSGYDLFNNFLIPLRKDWPTRSIKINVVYNGDEKRVKKVVENCIDSRVDVSILEINTARKNEKIRKGFIDLFYKMKDNYECTYKYNKELNENHLYLNGGINRISFYQDHCADLDCGHCRNIHLRIGPVGDELAIIPCFLRNINGSIRITEHGVISEKRFLESLNFVGRGPNWINWSDSN